MWAITERGIIVYIGLYNFYYFAKSGKGNFTVMNTIFSVNSIQFYEAFNF